VLREYALLADGERGVLIGPRGDFAWMCVPQWQDEAVFAALMGGDGFYAVTPTDVNNVWGGLYEDGTLIWRSRWVTTDSIIECREALAYPGNPHTAVVLRRIHPISGRAKVRVVLDVRAGYGSEDMTDLHLEDGVWHGRSGSLSFRWSGAEHAKPNDHGALEMVVEVEGSAHHDLVLELSDHEPSGDPPDADRTWVATEHAWDMAVPTLENTIAADDARQSYAVLRGMTSSTGAMVAAATMSLPERADSGRNYDYRYAWIRDQCYAGEAVAACGPMPLLDCAVHFVGERLLADGDQIKPAYTINGARVPDECDLDLPGYPGGTTTVGNWVNDQFQLDSLGESLLLFAAAAGHDKLDIDGWHAAETAVEAITKRWREPDYGIWELPPKRWAHSRLICAAGLRAIAVHAPRSQGSVWTSLADTLVADTASDCLTESGRWKRAPDDERVDASLLLPALRGALAPKDPRSIATLEAVRKDLGREGYVYRFSQDPRPLADAEGAFVMCGFDMAMATHQQGWGKEALRWFERNRAACGTPGLFTEEYDVEQRQLRGNVPQAFVHAVMIEAASKLAEPPREVTP
jgi:alpha,alpha-trehalase